MVARAVPAAQAVLLAEVGEGARDPGVLAGVAGPRLVGQPVDVAISRAGAAVLELPEPGGDPLGEHARAVRGQVGGLEGLDQEPVIRSALPSNAHDGGLSRTANSMNGVGMASAPKRSTIVFPDNGD